MPLYWETKFASFLIIFLDLNDKYYPIWAGTMTRLSSHNRVAQFQNSQLSLIQNMTIFMVP